MAVEKGTPGAAAEIKPRGRLGWFDSWLARVGALTAALAIIVPGGIAAKNQLIPTYDWRTRADEICLDYLDMEHEAEASVWDTERRFDLWPKKLHDLWQIDVPVQYELTWREYLNSEGDLEKVVRDSWDEERSAFNEALWSYGYGASQESYDRVQADTKKLGLSICGTEMRDSEEWVGLQFAIDRKPGASG